MAIYELTAIFQPEIKDKKGLIKEIEDWIKALPGKLEKKEEWGKKELAYPINKQREGFYLFWELETEPGLINNLITKIKLEENIIRHLLVRTN